MLWCKNQKDGTNAMVKLTVSDRFMQALSVYIKSLLKKVILW